MLSNLQTYGFFDDSLVKEGKLKIFALTVLNDRLGVERLDGTYSAKDMEALLGAFEDIVDELGVTRLVIDSITAVLLCSRRRRWTGRCRYPPCQSCPDLHSLQPARR